MDLKFSDFIDIPSVQDLIDYLYRISAIPTAILNPHGSVLLSAGRSAICEEHQRAFPEQLHHCFPQEVLAGGDGLHSGTGIWQEFQCQNGLNYMCTPIVLSEQHVATLLVGPLLHEPADPLRFAAKAEQCGYSEEAALAFLNEVPIVSAENVRDVLGLFGSLVKILSNSALQAVLNQDARRTAERSESKFRDLFTSSPDGIIISGLDGQTLEANPAMCALLGYERGAFLQGRLADFVSPGLSDQVPRRIAEIIERGQVMFETSLRHRSGHEIPVEVRGQAIMFDDSHAIIGQVRDLSVRRESELALRRSEERFRGIFEDAGIGMVLSDQRGRFVQVNPEFCRFLGYARHELLDKTIEEVTHPADRAASAQLIQEGLRGQRAVIDLEKRYLHKDGSTVWGRVKAVYRLSGTEPGLTSVAMVQDITAQKRALEAVQMSEATIRSLLVAVPMSVGLVHNRTFSWVNRWMLDELGYPEHELIGQSARILYESDAEFERVGRLKYGQLPFAQMGEVQTRFKCRDGRCIDVLLRSVPIDPDDLEAGVIFTALNISEIKSADAELRKAFDQAETARQQLNAVLRSVSAGLIVIEPDGVVSMANPAAEELLYFDADTMTGEPIEAVLDTLEFLEQVQLALAGSEQPERIEISLGDKEENAELFLQIRVATVEEMHGGVRGAVAILRDVTREHQINQLKDEFISTAAHELRTPMTSILGYTELMLEQLDDFETSQLKEFLQIVFERSESLSQIISDMLDLSRVQSGRLISLEKYPGDLVSLVRQIVTSYEYNVNSCEIIVNAEENLPLIFFDPRKLTQVFDNLLSNAVKFSPDGGAVAVIVRSIPGGISVVIRDQGVGMSAAQKERVFDKFYRADYSNTAVSGLGLGMSLVKSIIEGHDGRIWIETEPGKGTDVYFTLPGISLSKG